MNTFINSIVFTITIIFVSACSDQNKIVRDLDTYAERLQSYTGIPLPSDNLQTSLSAPSKSELKQDIKEITINLHELYALNDCALQSLIAQRNTALGKMQLPSTRYAYESQLLGELASCLARLGNSDENLDAIDKLSLWETEKNRQLPFVWANLITQSSEVYKHMTTTSGYISGNSSDNFQTTKQALNFLINVESNHPIDLSALEFHLKNLNDNPLLAKKWKTQLLLTQRLNEVSTLLKTYLSENQCQTLSEKQSIEIMQNIFRKLFVQAIQPVAGELNKYHYQLKPHINTLIESPYFTETFTAFLIQQNNRNYQTYKQSMQTHIELWQAIFALCD